MPSASVQPPKLTHIATTHLDLSPAATLGSHPVLKPAGSFQRFIPIPTGTLTFHSSPTGSDSTRDLVLDIVPGSSHDLVTAHPSLGVVSLDISLLFTTNPTGDEKPTFFRFSDRGTPALDSLTGKILQSHPEARSTEFGECPIFEVVKCQTDSEEFGWLNWVTLIGQGRFLVGDNGEGGKKLIGVEFQIFKVGI